MINATVISASCSALTLAPHIEKSCGITGKDFMQIVMKELAEMGVPGAGGMFETQECKAAGSSQSFSAAKDSGQGFSLA